MVDFKKYLANEKRMIDGVLEDYLGKELNRVKEIDDSSTEMIELIRDQVLCGGKRARPMLVNLAYRIGGGREFEKIKGVLVFAELMHSYILVHDDIADQDLLRYGGDTLEVKYANLFKERFGGDNQHFGKSLAIVCGDYMNALAHRALFESDLRSDVVVEVGEIMEDVFSDVAFGWTIHFWQNFEELKKANVEKYLKGLRLVSARYSFEGPLLIGARLCGCGEKLTNNLRSYGTNVGVAFQLRDDVLGVFGESSKTGKPVGNDIREGKKTILVLKAYQSASKSQRQVLERLVGKRNISSEEIDIVREIIVDKGALKESADLAKKHVSEATKDLEKIESEDKDSLVRLKELAEFVVQRSY